MGYRIAVIGATGNVGTEMLTILAESDLDIETVYAVASRKSVGREAVSKTWSPKIAAAGAVVIDNSSTWRMDPDVPLVVPEVNADAVAGYTKKNIID